MTRLLLAAAFVAVAALPARADEIVCAEREHYQYACVNLTERCVYGSLGAEANFGSRECWED